MSTAWELNPALQKRVACDGSHRVETAARMGLSYKISGRTSANSVCDLSTVVSCCAKLY